MRPRGRGTSASAVRSRSRSASRRCGVTRAAERRGGATRSACPEACGSRLGGVTEASADDGDSSAVFSRVVAFVGSSELIVETSPTSPASSAVVGWAATGVDSGGGITPGSFISASSSMAMAAGPPAGNSTTTGPGVHSRTCAAGSRSAGINPSSGASSSSEAMRIGRLAALIRSASGLRPVAAVAGPDWPTIE